MKPGPKTTLFTNEYLRSGQWLTSADERHYALMGTDGRLCACEGTGPTDPASRMLHMFPATAGQAGNYFAIMQSDGNLVIYRGTGPGDNQGFVWGLNNVLTTLPMPAGTRYSMVLDDQGNMRCYDHSVDVREGPYWSAVETHAPEEDTLACYPISFKELLDRSGAKPRARRAFQPRYTSDLTSLVIAWTSPEIHTTQPATVSIFRGDIDSTDLMRALPVDVQYFGVQAMLHGGARQTINFPLSAPRLVGGEIYSLEIAAYPASRGGLIVALDVPDGVSKPADNHICFNTFIRRN